jgi:hypothetical protein
VIRRASDILLSRPGVKNAVAFVGLDGATFTNAPELLRMSANVTDLETGLPLLIDREPAQINFLAVPPILGENWACEGTMPSKYFMLDPRGLDDDDSVPAWEELCGRAVRLDVSLRDNNSLELATTSVELVLAPSPDDADTCP